MTSDAENDVVSRSHSPEDSGDQESGDMAERSEYPGKSDAPASTTNVKPKANAKDPLRPRRKKARRACFACQRAHLTCGDERPCQRCIKRNLQDQCHDGVRKKAKYLHDAPNEALMPGIGPSHFQYANAVRQGDQRAQHPQYPGLPPNTMYSSQQIPTSAFPIYPPTAPQVQIPPNLSEMPVSPQSYGSQQSPLSSRFNTSGPQNSSMPNFADVINATTEVPNTMQNAFTANVIDPNDPLSYQFDLASFNFGNRYGALEFGMLGHMSSGAAETPPSDAMGHIAQNSANQYSGSSGLPTTYGDTPVNVQPYLFNQDQDLAGGWQHGSQANMRQNNSYNSNVHRQESPHRVIKQESIKQDTPYAFMIGAGSSSLASPVSTSSPQAVMSGFEETASNANILQNNQHGSRPGTQARSAQQRQSGDMSSGSESTVWNVPLPPTRDSSMIYDTVTKPYSYTAGFHSLTAFIQRHFSKESTLRIAKALASIRPSFISCTKTLTHNDLIFMEKCFQRTLYEYEDFISKSGTPTIVCRRTGEVAAVGKEFSILTGWKKNVLLGKEPNLNVNTGGVSAQPSITASSTGTMNTPRMTQVPRPDPVDPSRPQPVFLAEILDEDSVIEFYEDFARLAFGDSRGTVTTRCKLMKYKTQEDISLAANETEAESMSRRRKITQSYGRNVIAGEAEIEDLASQDGKIECSYCWFVKRDVFDIPMLIVMNFLPCI